MRHLSLLLATVLVSLPAIPQATNSDEATLSKARSLYDAPFTRQLISFDCAVQFDWKKHFMDMLGTIPPTARPTTDRLQTLQHRVFVDRSGAVVSEIPKATDLSGIPHGTDLETTLQAIVSSGLNAWLPFGTNVILPLKPTKFSFQVLDTGFKVDMHGTNVAATLLLLPDMRITRVNSDLPQPLHFATEFMGGPDGFLLQSVKTGSDPTNQNSWEAGFLYRYQDVSGFQLPAEVVVTQYATGEKWDYSLSDCKAVTGKTIELQTKPR